MNREPIVLEKGKLAGAIFTVFALLYIIISVLGGTLIVGLDETSAYRYAISACFSPIAFIITVIFFKAHKKGDRNYLALSKTAPVNYLYGVMLFIAMFLGLSTLNVHFINFLKSMGVSAPETVININGFFEYILLVFTLAVIPAVVEEILFRGLILNHTVGKNKWATYFAVGFLFAVFHGSISQLLYQFVYGVLLCAITDKAKSVFPAILAHFLNNFVVLTAEYLGFNLGLIITNPIFIIIGLLLLFGYVFLMIYKSRKHENSSDVSGLFMPYGLFGVLVFLMLIILGAL